MSPTPETVAAVDQHVRRDAIARAKRGHPTPDLDDLAGEFVAEDDRRLPSGQRVWLADRDEERSRAVLFEIRAADPARPDLDDDLARPRCTRLWHVLDAHVVACVP